MYDIFIHLSLFKLKYIPPIHHVIYVEYHVSTKYDMSWTFVFIPVVRW